MWRNHNSDYSTVFVLIYLFIYRLHNYAINISGLRASNRRFMERMWRKCYSKYRKYLEETEKNAPYIKMVGAHSRLKKKVLHLPLQPTCNV